MECRPAGWSVSASVNLPLHHEVQKFFSGTGSPGWSQKKGRKMVVCDDYGVVSQNSILHVTTNDNQLN